ncbi:hypothetical protein GNP89_19875 [Aliivibrio fischeri]|uniref:hypothetical protein n=1 Tax=Aliivibrio fischeri TaxID=668 RepID=UPI0012D9FD84|nr:hypothetical protein [Aliivibrio fischeri]MUL04415.1 hypothetical protein [Aliivibrio fischeri]
MDISIAFKAITALVALLGLRKLYFDVLIGKSSRLRDDYRFSKEFFNDISEGNLHPYSIEKGYQALANTTEVSTNEIKYILTLDRPIECLNDYVLAHSYLEEVSAHEGNRISFKKKYADKSVRSRRKALYISLYAIFVYLAFAPLILGKVNGFSLEQVIIAQCISFPCFGAYAWLFLKSGARIYRGEKLVKNQSKYTSKIIVKT